MTRIRELKVFRASLGIRLAVLVALAMWLSVFFITAFIGGVPTHVFVSIAFFILFFLVFVAYYFSMTYVVDEYGVTYRGATEFEHFDWEETLRVDGSRVPLGGYYVTTTHGSFVLSRFLQGHEALAELIIARAGLMPQTR